MYEYKIVVEFVVQWVGCVEHVIYILCSVWTVALTYTLLSDIVMASVICFHTGNLTRRESLSRRKQ